MITVYTTQRCLQIEESYKVISEALIDEKNNFLNYYKR